MSSKFSVGDDVMVRWPGSKLWFAAKILGFNGKEYRVRFDEGTEDELTESYIKTMLSFKRRSPSRSPSRRRSRSRSPARSPSRQRISRSPSRKVVAQTPVRKQTITKAATESKASVKRPPTPTRSVTKRISTTKVTTEVHPYTTRSSIKLGQGTLEPLIDMKMGRVPRTMSYEFGGPIGVFFALLALPLFAYYLYFACSKELCSFQLWPAHTCNWRDYYDSQAYLVFLGWISLQAFLFTLPLGPVVKGMPLRTGHRMQYRLNGLFTLIISLLLFAGLIYKRIGLSLVYDKFLPLITAAIMVSAMLSILLYLKARYAPGHALAPSGNSGNVLYDFFMGHELNPRILNFDLKFFMLRTGQISLVVLDLAFVIKVWTDFPEQPPWPILLVTFFQLLYVSDSILHEYAVLSTMHVALDGLGFMLVFGDLVWVPFTYTLQARYLADRSARTIMPDYCLVIVLVFGLIGFYILRSSNYQKNAFRENPFSSTFAASDVLVTPSGRRLLVSGWWGWVRHPNYLGDLMVALACSLCCGFASVVPYFYPVYLLILLVHREMRDAAHCRQKYGAVWTKYCERVPYRIFPYVY